MNNINAYSMHAELAQAAYGTFSAGLINDGQLTVKEVGMSTSQAVKFSEKWQASAQYNDPVTGVSATVFKEIATGIKHLAIRGTEQSGGDILADGLLATSLPPTLNPQYIALQLKLSNDWLNDPAVLQGESFTVSGHSLGGYLAAAVKQNYAQVTDAYLYNTPGVSGLLGNLADAISSALGISSISPDNIWNVRGSEGFPIIAGLDYQLGTPVNIQTEATLKNHSISVLADALAVYPLYSQFLPDKKLFDRTFCGSKTQYFSLIISKFFNKILLAIIFLFFFNQNVYSEKYNVNPAIDEDFISWSNSMPEKEALEQLKDFLSSFNSWEEAKAWFISKGFSVNSVAMSEHVAKIYGLHFPAFSAVAAWSEQGIIFSNGWFLKLESKIFVHGWSVGIHFTENGEFTVHRIKVVATIL